MKAGLTIDMIEHDDYEEANMRSYQRPIGKLVYLLCGTCPDITFVVGQLSRQNANHCFSHMCWNSNTSTTGWCGRPAGYTGSRLRSRRLGRWGAISGVHRLTSCSPLSGCWDGISGVHRLTSVPTSVGLLGFICSFVVCMDPTRPAGNCPHLRPK